MTMMGRTLAVAIAMTAATTLVMRGTTPPLAAQDASSSVAGTADGTWTARLPGEHGRELQIRLARWDTDSRWNSNLVLSGAEARDFLDFAHSAENGGTFRLEREAGTLTLVGQIRRERGVGEYIFTERSGYRDVMRDLGYGRLDDEEVFASAMLDVGPRHARRMAEIGFADLELDELMSASIFRVDGAYIEDLRRVGFGDLDFDQLVAFRVFEIDADFIAEARAGRLSDLDADDLVAMKVHGITAEAVQEARGLGLGNLDFDDVVAMKIHGVTAGYLESLRALDIRVTDVDDAMALRIHGVTADWVRELREDGFEDLDEEDLIRMRIHGIDDILRKRRVRRRN